MPFAIGRAFAEAQIRKDETGPNSCTVCNIFMKFSLQIDIDRI